MLRFGGLVWVALSVMRLGSRAGGERLSGGRNPARVGVGPGGLLVGLYLSVKTLKNEKMRKKKRKKRKKGGEY